VLRIIRGKYNPIPSTFSKDLVAIVDMCLSRDYKKRPNAREILSTSSKKKKTGDAIEKKNHLFCKKIKKAYMIFMGG